MSWLIQGFTKNYRWMNSIHKVCASHNFLHGLQKRQWRWVKEWAGVIVVHPAMSWNMMTSSNGNNFCLTDPLCGVFIGQWWILRTKASDARSFDIFFDLCPNKRLSKQSWRRWFETLSGSLWRHCNDSGSSSSLQYWYIMAICDHIERHLIWNMRKSGDFINWRRSLIGHAVSHAPFRSTLYHNHERIMIW